MTDWAMAAQLSHHGSRMESTGVYWIPQFEMLDVAAALQVHWRDGHLLTLTLKRALALIDDYEQKYRQRVVKNLTKRAAEMGFDLKPRALSVTGSGP